MKFLLDTHIWIWALDSPGKLSRSVRREFEKRDNELYLSPVSIWEAHHLEKRKRLRLQQGFSRWLDEVPVLGQHNLEIAKPPRRRRRAIT